MSFFIFPNDKNFSQLGMSMVEVMIGLSMAAVLSAIIMGNIQLQTKSQKKAVLDTNILEIRRLMQDFVGRKEPCNATFQGVSKGENVLFLKFKEDFTGSYFAQIGKEFKKTGIMIKSMKLLSLKEESDLYGISPLSTSGTNTGVGHAVLRVVLEKMVKNNKPQDFVGGRTTQFDVTIVASFSDLYYGIGLSPNEAIDSWKIAFEKEKNELIALVAGMGLKPSDLSNTELTKQSDRDPAITDTDAFNKVAGEPYMSVDWDIGHHLYPISDCGNHISTGTN
jgi:type II secretory pathway pseudopilin PulG